MIDAGGTNSGTIQAIDSGIVKIDNSVVNNAGGNVEGLAESARVQLANSDIAGGTLTTDGLSWTSAGIIEIVAAFGQDISLFDGSAQAVTVDGYVRIDEGANLELKGTIHNHGTIEVDSGAPSPTA